MCHLTFLCTEDGAEGHHNAGGKLRIAKNAAGLPLLPEIDRNTPSSVVQKLLHQYLTQLYGKRMSTMTP
jgi:hypothetical protein